MHRVFLKIDILFSLAGQIFAVNLAWTQYTIIWPTACHVTHSICDCDDKPLEKLLDRNTLE